MNCIIVDDEMTARVIIRELCEQVNNLEVVAEFSNAMEAIKYLNHNDVDLIFLDVYMPGFTGFDFIQTIKNPPKIILTTSDALSAREAFEYDCIVDYLVKPLSVPRFKKAINKAQSHITKALESKENDLIGGAKVKKEISNVVNDLYINIERRLIKINIPSIYLVEAKGDYINVKTETENYRVHSTLKKIEEKLPKNLFLKVHRSFVINVKKIIDIEDNTVLIKKEVIPISRSNRPELMKRLNLL